MFLTADSGDRVSVDISRVHDIEELYRGFSLTLQPSCASAAWAQSSIRLAASAVAAKSRMNSKNFGD